MKILKLMYVADRLYHKLLKMIARFIDKAEKKADVKLEQTKEKANRIADASIAMLVRSQETYLDAADRHTGTVKNIQYARTEVLEKLKKVS